MLNRLLTDRPEAQELDGAGREVITEVGNIVLNACLGVFGNLLQVQEISLQLTALFYFLQIGNLMPGAVQVGLLGLDGFPVAFACDVEPVRQA